MDSWMVNNGSDGWLGAQKQKDWKNGINMVWGKGMWVNRWSGCKV